MRIPTLARYVLSVCAVVAIAGCGGSQVGPLSSIQQNAPGHSKHGKHPGEPGCSFSSSANFNGTAVPAGRTLWFTSVVKAKGIGSSPVIVNVTQAVVSFTANNTPYSIALPNFAVTFVPGGTTATISYGSGGWTESVPAAIDGNVLVGAGEYPVTSNLPGGIHNVTMTATFNTTQSGITLQWAWSAAVYSQFSTDYSALGVKPVDDNKMSQYKNSDHAGTPENYKSYVVGGAMGGGGSNYTGSLSGTSSVTPCVSQSGLFVSAGSNGVLEYAPPYTGQPTAISNGIEGPAGLALDASGNLYVGNDGNNTVTEYAPPYTGAPILTIDVTSPSGLAFDASGNLYAGTNGGGSAGNVGGDVAEYAPPYTGAPVVTISNGMNGPGSSVFDASGNLYVLQGGTTITEYAPPFTDSSAPVVTISPVHRAEELAFDASGNLYVANSRGGAGDLGSVYVYAPPFTDYSAPILTISNSVDNPFGLAFDTSGNLFVANYTSENVTEYAPPYSGAPFATISLGYGVYPSNGGLAWGPTYGAPGEQHRKRGLVRQRSPQSIPTH